MDPSLPLTSIEPRLKNLSPAKAWDKMTEYALDLSLEELETERTVGRILAEEIQADRDFPPYDRVAMDGIAVSIREFNSGTRKFTIQGAQPAGAQAMDLNPGPFCLEIMTGSILPRKADAVIPYEDIALKNGAASIEKKMELKPNLNIHQKGSDKHAGELLISPGKKLTAPDIAAIASVGKSKVSVRARASIATISTGDELVSVEDMPLDHQVRRSNCIAMESALRGLGYSRLKRIHLPDDRESLRSGMKEMLKISDVLLLTGGVSKGKWDLVPEVLADLGIEKIFHGISQKPGKPFYFGVQTQVDKTTKAVFGLPGNPVAVMVCFYRYVLPYLSLCEGSQEPYRPKVRLNENDLPKYFGKTLFLPIAKSRHEGKIVRGNGSGDLTHLLLSDGFIEYTGIVEEKGYPFYSWGSE